LPELPAVNLTATFDADLIQAMGLKVTRVSAKTTLSGGQFLETMTGSVAQGGIVQSLKVDLRNRKLLDLSLDTKLNGVQIHDVLVGMKDRLPPGAAQSLHDKLYGKGNATVSARVKAPIRDASKKLSADLYGNFIDGKIANFPAVAKFSTMLHGMYSGIPELNELSFGKLEVRAKLEDGKLLIQDMTVDGSSLGMIAVNGTIGADRSLDLNTDTHLPEAISAPILSASEAGNAAIKNLTGPLGFDPGVRPPTDDKKRVIIPIKIKGSIDDPDPTGDKTRASTLAKGAAAALANEAKAKAEAFAKEQTDKLKAEAEARARSEAAKVKAEAEKKATEVVKEKAGEQGAKAVDALKKKIKLPGF
ncbi:MAG: AsmA-like C-terminal region, partial [Fibrobacterota bacterium]